MDDASGRVSVVISTYNWSAALRCSIQSVLWQTYSGFELMVVGDGCTDDSADVVASFGDPRIRWLNLPANTGGQSMPNNAGIENSTGDYIAYLGHDDIWYPTHLESLVRTMRETQADMVAAVMILYGPPGSGLAGTSGIFATGTYCPKDFLPPSSVMHSRALVGRIGAWREPFALSLPADVEFQKRAYDAGARIASSNELTAFKFNAAWRRNSYVKKSVAEQEEMLAKIQSGMDFRTAALTDVLRSIACGRYVPIVTPPPRPAGEYARENRRFKGTSDGAAQLQRVEKRTRFYLDDQAGGFEWYALEKSWRWRSYRWSGPLQRSSLEFPILRAEPLAVRVHITRHVQNNIFEDVSLLIDGERCPAELRRCMDGTFILSATIPPSDSSDKPLLLSLEVARTARPCDLGIGPDTRWLGVAVSWVEFAPGRLPDRLTKN